MALSFTLSAAERAWLGRLARQSIALASGGSPVLPEVSDFAGAAGSREAPAGEHPVLRRPLGAFVTITCNGALRGCIGAIVGRAPLAETVWRMARAAALEDPRFPPLTVREWEQAALEISVLDELAPCPDPARIEVGRHGLVLQYGGRSGVFLPQVPVEQGWDRETCLEHLCAKAGVPHGAWRRPEARLFWYEALVFPA